MNVQFLQRNFITANIPNGVAFHPTGYSWKAQGGPDTATLEVTGMRDDLYTLLTWTRYAVTIYNDPGQAVWWGYVSSVTITDGGVTITASLDAMTNRVAVAYTLTALGDETTGPRRTTAWTQDDISVGEFGTKELLDSLGGTSAAHAEAMRGRRLGMFKYPVALPTVEPGAVVPGEINEVTCTMECSGWWNTLAWRYATIPTTLAFSYQTIGALEQTVGYQPDPTKSIYFETVGTTLQELGKDNNDDALNVTACGESFVPAVAYSGRTVGVYIQRVGAPPGDLTLSIYSSDAGSPNEQLGSATFAKESVPASAGWVEARFDTLVTLNAGSTYWAVVSTDGLNADAYYQLTLDEGQGYGGAFKRKRAAGWITGVNADMPFRVYTDTTVYIQAVAQGFSVLSAAWNVQEIEVYVKKTGTPPADLTIAIYSEDAATHYPSSSLASADISKLDITTSYGWVRATLSSPLTLTANTAYYLVVSTTTDTAAYYTLEFDEAQGYSGGKLYRQDTDDSTWHLVEADMPFKIFTNVLVPNEQQVKTLISLYGQFLGRVDVWAASGISTESYRNGDSDALFEIEELLNAGNTSGRRLLAAVNADRSVTITTEPTPTNMAEYGYTRDGHFVHGVEVLDSSTCPVGFWAHLLNVLPQTIDTNTLSGLGSFFIERTEYETATGLLRFEPLGLADVFDLEVRDG